VFRAPATGCFINKCLCIGPAPPLRCEFSRAGDETIMIRILIAEPLSAHTIDKLNEIPEFEIIEKTFPTTQKLAAEIKNVDALVASKALRLSSAIPAGAAGLKIIILTGGGPNPMETELAKQKNIEIRSTTSFPAPADGAGSQDREGLEVIAILKDFFNV
jgi:hypothetical protein